MFWGNVFLSNVNRQLIPQSRYSCRETPVTDLWLCLRHSNVWTSDDLRCRRPTSVTSWQLSDRYGGASDSWLVIRLLNVTVIKLVTACWSYDTILVNGLPQPTASRAGQRQRSAHDSQCQFDNRTALYQISCTLWYIALLHRRQHINWN